MWYALDNDKAEYEYSFNYQNWYPSVEYESKNTIKMLVCLNFLLFQNMKLKEKSI